MVGTALITFSRRLGNGNGHGPWWFGALSLTSLFCELLLYSPVSINPLSTNTLTCDPMVQVVIMSSAHGVPCTFVPQTAPQTFLMVPPAR